MKRIQGSDLRFLIADLRSQIGVVLVSDEDIPGSFL
jgi:hypothetical protein